MTASSRLRKHKKPLHLWENRVINKASGDDIGLMPDQTMSHLTKNVTPAANNFQEQK
jgi:hypothetical protein